MEYSHLSHQTTIWNLLVLWGKFEKVHSKMVSSRVHCLEWQQLTIQGCWFRGQENWCINLNLHQKPFSGKTFDIADLELKELCFRSCIANHHQLDFYFLKFTGTYQSLWHPASSFVWFLNMACNSTILWTFLCLSYSTWWSSSSVLCKISSWLLVNKMGSKSF